jgi:hypothetical protein
MLPKYHISLGFIFSLIIYLFFNISFINFSLIFLSSFLIDFDHYLWYLFKTKDWNLMNCVRELTKRRDKILKLTFNEREKIKRGVYLFHGIEFWILLICLSLLFDWFFFIFLGVIFHMLLDFIEMIYTREPISMKLSVVYKIYFNKNKKEFR